MKRLFSILLLTLAQPVLASDLIAFTQQQRVALAIETAAVETAHTRNSTNLPGKVTVPNAQLHVVTAPQKGLIETLLAAEGEVVKQGQALASIQSPALLELQSEYLEIHTRYQLAKSNFDRDRQLNEEGIIAERRLLESKAKYQELLTTASRIKRMLELSGMDEQSLVLLRKNRDLNSTLVVTAPFDGVVLEQMTTAGNRVEAADPLYRIASLKPLWLEIHVPLEQLDGILPGQSVQVPSLNISGLIVTIGKMVHEVDQGVLIRAEIHDGAEKLRPGQFLQVQLATTSDNKSYRLPRNAVIHSAGSSYVFLAQQEGFFPVLVKVVSEETNALIVEANFPEHSQIAISGTAAIKAAWLGGE